MILRVATVLGAKRGINRDQTNKQGELKWVRSDTRIARGDMRGMRVGSTRRHKNRTKTIARTKT